ncbi:30S ribosomal protein S7 [Candidatus Pacearchaeota archaeon]|nr:30S ribosomal protein S7 [Candidatus Pacearchaeota archaeon]
MTTETSSLPVFKAFDKYDLTEVVITDLGLKSAINLTPKLMIQSHGRNVGKMGQAKVNIIERLMNKLAVAGHRGKKHRLERGSASGKYTKNMGIVLEAFDIVEKKTGKNPVQVLVNAIEKAAPMDEVTVIEYGGTRYPQAVDVSPLRRVGLALKHIAHGSSDKAFGKKKTYAQALADELILAADSNGDSFAYRKKNEAEKQADSAR